MAFVGFIVMAIVMFKATIFTGLCVLNNMGTYNIGGVPNSFKKKFFTLILVFVCAYLWYVLYQNAPFSINWK